MLSEVENALEHLVSAMRLNNIAFCEVPAAGGNLLLELSSAGGQKYCADTLDRERVEEILSPEMGVVDDILVQEGTEVNSGQLLAFVRIGPIRVAIKAPEQGTVKSCLVQPHEVVGYHQAMFALSV
ncbi:hypothetical protein AA106555_1626 [Neokomagataea thailandica NBRC 106555]|uniref:Lipoyl-binding domain-containing protein n=2 Tax=Neokomagataea TaxID=1223423 RepID=A0A4Y6VA77_9PROT|nr:MULTISPECIES: biotin/lipoyl-containing protein [Neokomagataea]QDH25255.1 hypothetical protein D5366_08570 [Neokomagataea tanensis]GBR54294.1 hypothetical protein AA106555_1626 [Neokomagataea thailandica NBRC 106555]